MKDISRRAFLGKAGVGLVGLLGLASEANANRLNLFVKPSADSGVAESQSSIGHHSTLGDKPYLEGPAPIIDCYVWTDGQKLGRDCEGHDSLETKTIYIAGRGLNMPVETDVFDAITPLYGEENMVGKKINMDLYERVDDGAGSFNYVQTGSFNGRSMNSSQQPIIINVSNGEDRGGVFYPSHKIQVSFSYNKETDLNNDRRVDYDDLAQLSQDWLKPTGNHLSDLSGPEGVSDGEVNMFDLSRFVQDWMQ